MYIYACVYVFVHLCVYAHVYVYVCAYLCLDCGSWSVLQCVDGVMHAHVFSCAYVCVYVCVLVVFRENSVVPILPAAGKFVSNGAYYQDSYYRQPSNFYFYLLRPAGGVSGGATHH